VQLESRDIIVFGASSGIGREVALNYSRLPDVRVFALARRADLLKALADEACNGNIIAIPTDIVDCDFSSLLGHLKSHSVSNIGVVVNCVGALVNKPFVSISKQEWQAVYLTNVIGPAQLIRCLLPHLGQGSVSHVVNIGSMGGIGGTVKFPGLSAYSSSKGALSILTEVLAEEFKESQVVFNCLALGSVNTEMLAKAFPGYQAATTAEEMASFICDFGLKGWRFFNGKVLPVSISTP
jgi:NAD(P)-dependent dehydrogenase (short-subunit alcohol dehydrogenase family)